MRANINWAAWAGVAVSVAIVAGGGAVSCGILQQGQSATNTELTAFRAEFRDYVTHQDEKQQKLDDRLRAVEIAQGKR